MKYVFEELSFKGLLLEVFIYSIKVVVKLRVDECLDGGN